MSNGTKVLSAEDDCVDCKFFKPKSAILRPGEEQDESRGRCLYQPPPAVARLYGMLNAEHLTKIDYEAVFNSAPEAMRHSACSEFKPKVGH